MQLQGPLAAVKEAMAHLHPIDPAAAGTIWRNSRGVAQALRHPVFGSAALKPAGHSGSKLSVAPSCAKQPRGHSRARTLRPLSSGLPACRQSDSPY